MNKTPWLSKKSLRIVRLLINSYQEAYGENLLTPLNHQDSDLTLGEKLFTMRYPVMAHTNATEPCLNYANSIALEIWITCWKDMIGMPSRLTTPREDQEQRNYALQQTTKKNAIDNYQGTRINSKGELFKIQHARIWTIWDEKSHNFGQAATFSCWWKI